MIRLRSLMLIRMRRMEWQKKAQNNDASFSEMRDEERKKKNEKEEYKNVHIRTILQLYCKR